MLLFRQSLNQWFSDWSVVTSQPESTWLCVLKGWGEEGSCIIFWITLLQVHIPFSREPHGVLQDFLKLGNCKKCDCDLLLGCKCETGCGSLSHFHCFKAVGSLAVIQPWGSCHCPPPVPANTTCVLILPESMRITALNIILMTFGKGGNLETIFLISFAITHFIKSTDLVMID